MLWCWCTGNNNTTDSDRVVQQLQRIKAFCHHHGDYLTLQRNYTTCLQSCHWLHEVSKQDGNKQLSSFSGSSVTLLNMVAAHSVCRPRDSMQQQNLPILCPCVPRWLICHYMGAYLVWFESKLQDSKVMKHRLDHMQEYAWATKKMQMTREPNYS